MRKLVVATLGVFAEALVALVATLPVTRPGVGEQQSLAQFASVATWVTIVAVLVAAILGQASVAMKDPRNPRRRLLALIALGGAVVSAVAFAVATGSFKAEELRQVEHSLDSAVLDALPLTLGWMVVMLVLVETILVVVEGRIALPLAFLAASATVPLQGIRDRFELSGGDVSVKYDDLVVVVAMLAGGALLWWLRAAVTSSGWLVLFGALAWVGIVVYMGQRPAPTTVYASAQNSTAYLVLLLGWPFCFLWSHFAWRRKDRTLV